MGQGLLDDIFSGQNGIANTMINLLGTSIIISYTTETDYDPTTMSPAGTVDTSYTIDASPPTPYATRDIDGTTILQGDMQLLIPTYQTPEKPPIGAKITYNSEVWTIEGADDIQSGNEGAAYRIRMRRS